MPRRHSLIGLGLTILVATSVQAQNKRSSATIGDLVVTVLDVAEEEPANGDDHHLVKVGIRIENFGKRATCEYFTAKLTTTFDLEYRTVLFGYDSDEPKVRDLLPGETAKGHYAFQVKNGVKPVELVLKGSGDQSCGAARRSYGSGTYYQTEYRFDLIGFWQMARPESLPHDIGQTSRQRVSHELDKVLVTDTRVFSTGTTVSPPDPDILKAFGERCPGLTATLDRTKAGYILVVVPAGSSRIKHKVVVFSTSGEMVYSGDTFAMKNAVKDACNAILQHSSAHNKSH